MKHKCVKIEKGMYLFFYRGIMVRITKYSDKNWSAYVEGKESDNYHLVSTVENLYYMETKKDIVFGLISNIDEYKSKKLLEVIDTTNEPNILNNL